MDLLKKWNCIGTYYFSELLVEENTYVKEGTKLLKYTNGTYLEAPYDLVITNHSLPEVEEMCTDLHYLEVQTTETLASNIEMNESDMQYITLGQEVEVVVNAFPETIYKGYITQISETATNAKFTATVTLINDGTIKLGMSGYCTMNLQEIKDVVAVPVEAINVREDDTKYVLAKNEQEEVVEINVETGTANSKYVEIKEGISAGQVIQYIDVATGEAGTAVESSQGRSGARQIMRMF